LNDEGLPFVTGIFSLKEFAMKVILLSGGSGKRLWPLSSDARSKQFLKVLINEKNERESMVQRVWKQLKKVNLAESAFLSTSQSQVEMIQTQLGNKIPLIIEPLRRDTFPAIALASVYLYSQVKVDVHEVICILPVDPFVEDVFFQNVRQLENMIHQEKADIALIGVKPTYPSEKYGYIVPAQNAGPDGTHTYKTVSHFIEKPKEGQAKKLIEQGALWNCGVFAFKLDYMISLLKKKGFSTEYYDLVKQYSQLPAISFDYEVVEKATRLLVLPYDGKWKDLGTWNTLTEEMDTFLLGKGMISDDSKNTHVINELDIPVIVAGLSNLVVAACPDGILVTDKASSPKVKELIKDIKQRPMYEERRWGWYRVLDYTKLEDGNEVLTKKVVVKAGKNLSYQLHKKRSEVWTVISGEGVFVLEGAFRQIQSGDVLHIPVGSKHGIRAVSDLVMIEVQVGSELIEEDVIRLCMTWEEVEKLYAPFTHDHET
jgi:mannose-1-phosphate guanylyltransferase